MLSAHPQNLTLYKALNCTLVLSAHQLKIFAVDCSILNLKKSVVYGHIK